MLAMRVGDGLPQVIHTETREHCGGRNPTKDADDLGKETHSYHVQDIITNPSNAQAATPTTAKRTCLRRGGVSGRSFSYRDMVFGENINLVQNITIAVILSSSLRRT